MSDHELTIKPADKGSAVVVSGKYDYLLEAKDQLNNTKVYEKWSGNPLYIYIYYIYIYIYICMYSFNNENGVQKLRKSQLSQLVLTFRPFSR